MDYTDDELDWICNSAVSHSGERGLENIRHMFATAPKVELDALMMKIEVDHLKYLTDQQEVQCSDESNRMWKTVLDDFKRLNQAQQKAHLTYIKKHTNELTDEQLHILELISLGERTYTSETDVTVGGIKLFTSRKK